MIGRYSGGTTPGGVVVVVVEPGAVVALAPGAPALAEAEAEGWGVVGAGAGVVGRSWWGRSSMGLVVVGGVAGAGVWATAWPVTSNASAATVTRTATGERKRCDTTLVHFAARPAISCPRYRRS